MLKQTFDSKIQSNQMDDAYGVMHQMEQAEWALQRFFRN